MYFHLRAHIFRAARRPNREPEFRVGALRRGVFLRENTARAFRFALVALAPLASLAPPIRAFSSRSPAGALQRTVYDSPRGLPGSGIGQGQEDQRVVWGG